MPAQYAVVVCPPVRHKPVLMETTERIEMVLAGRLPSTYPTLCCKEICVSPKLGVLKSLWNFVPNSGLRKFRHGKSIALSTKLVDGRARWRHLYETVDESCMAVYYKSINCSPLTSLLSFAVYLPYNLFLQLRSSWQDFNRLCASRGPYAVAELLVK